MASSDDEKEPVPDFVSNYHFEDNNDSISFSVLPIRWSASKTVPSKKQEIVMHGYTDAGLRKIYMPVKAWKFDISRKKPEISVLSKDNNWIKLEKPRNSYKGIVKSVLVTVNFLHLIKNNPEVDKKAIWSMLSRTCSQFDDKPASKDLVCHKAIIEEAVKQDESLSKSEYLVTLLEKMPHMKKRDDEDVSTEKKDFIVDDDEEEDDCGEEEDESGDEEGGSEEEDGDEEPFDSVCCLCDDGGSLLCCDGVCMRSFHATLKDGKRSKCHSLGFTEQEVKAIPSFKCQNCRYNRHQCYACGELGSSDKSSGAEVFQCVNATCGYFYHPRCVAKRLHRDNEVAAKELQDKILAGESFACPLHICSVCKQPEDKIVSELHMAVCRRCPRAYHKKCLPSKIVFEDDFEDNEEADAPRAWKGLLVDRILIYCLKHAITDLGTPERNHIKFTDDEKKPKHPSAMARKDNSIPVKKKPLEGSSFKTGTTQPNIKSIQDGHRDEKNIIKSVKARGLDPPRKSSTEKKSVLKKGSGSSRTESHKVSLGDELYALYSQSDLVKLSKPEKLDEDDLTKASKRPTKKIVQKLEDDSKTSKPATNTIVADLDIDSQRRILDLMKEVSSLITMDDIIDKHDKVIPLRKYKQQVEKNKAITQGKVEHYCKSVREASRVLDAGGSVEEAKRIFEPKVLNQLLSWKTKLRVYLSPFLYGLRYTSFGRHFTKIQKLEEIVDRLHWYINSGDMIVDFCCGANDFSWLMKRKLDQTGKKCSFKNYDLFHPKNDFCFEKRDWMTVQPNELPPGSQLVMGLNPPFGVKARLANEFIDQALKFKPKLVILIVPPETERLDKKAPYDLIWEDTEKLSGKSFYLPGSVDEKDNQLEDWNIVAPVLSLWSHRDWSARHRAIAQKHTHLDGGNQQVRELPSKTHDNNELVLKADVSTPKTNPPGEPKERDAPSIKERDIVPAEDPGKQSVRVDPGDEKHKSSALVNSRDNQGSNRMNMNREDKKRRANETLPEQRKRQHSSPLGNPSRSGPRHSPEFMRTGRHSREREMQLIGYSSGHQNQRSPSDMEIEPPCEIQPTTYETATPYSRGGSYDGYHSPYYPERIVNCSNPGTVPYSSEREGWSNQGYRRERAGYGYNQPLSIEPVRTYRPPTYSMGGANGYNSTMNSMPATQRYALPLNAVNHPSPRDSFAPPMARDAPYNFQNQGSRHADDFALGPVSYSPRNYLGGPPLGGWLHEG